MHMRTLGNSSLEVSAPGLGLNHSYGPHLHERLGR